MLCKLEAPVLYRKDDTRVLFNCLLSVIIRFSYSGKQGHGDQSDKRQSEI